MKKLLILFIVFFGSFSMATPYSLEIKKTCFFDSDSKSAVFHLPMKWKGLKSQGEYIFSASCRKGKCSGVKIYVDSKILDPLDISVMEGIQISQVDNQMIQLNHGVNNYTFFKNDKKLRYSNSTDNTSGIGICE